MRQQQQHKQRQKKQRSYHLDQKRMAVGLRGPDGGNSGRYSPSNRSMSVTGGGGTWRRSRPALIGFLTPRRSMDSESWYGLLSLYVLRGRNE